MEPGAGYSVQCLSLAMFDSKGTLESGASCDFGTNRMVLIGATMCAVPVLRGIKAHSEELARGLGLGRDGSVRIQMSGRNPA